MRRPTIVLASALALVLAAGCGGSESTSASGLESAATVAPASALAYIAIDTDVDSGQWEQAQELLERFPARENVISQVRSALGEEDLSFEQDVEPALGPETALVIMTGENDVVGLTQPDDEAKFQALVDKLNEDGDEVVTREIGEWTALADSAAVLDAFEAASDEGQLEDDDAFQEALGELPEEALVKAYVSGEAAAAAAEDASGGSTDVLTGGGKLVSVAIAAEALDGGLKVSGTSRVEGGERQEAYESTLLERVPDDALAVFSFKDLGSGIEQARSAEGVAEALAQAEQVLGVPVADVTALFEGESILYVRPGAPIPEVTLLLAVEDEAAALATVDKVAARAVALAGARAGRAEVGGEEVKFIELQGIRVSYTTFDGVLAVTSGAAGIRDARGDGDKLADDERFETASEAAGMGDETNGFLYLDLADSIPLIEGLAGLAQQQLPSEVSENLAPLESFLAYAAQDGGSVNFSAFLGVSE